MTLLTPDEYGRDKISFVRTENSRAILFSQELLTFPVLHTSTYSGQLNRYIIASHFKLTNWKTVIHLLSSNDFLRQHHMNYLELLAVFHALRCFTLDILIALDPDPLAKTVDAFSLNWGAFYFYAFPLFILILKILRKVITEAKEMVVVS
ncbi:hypothetical protein ALC57_12551 [Trachymyrmex cornetzi]|uniref:Uncharacterized protein n=1 Tax=Trachymyrmex cornetzi TaxID=471704 RepID=A0A151J189_9HYME|nr:hypothetical protein ALC57_12551 [Trachymyrmex cornetzi]